MPQESYLGGNIQLFDWEMTFLEIPHKNVWVSWWVNFEGFGAQMIPRRPAG